VGVVGLIYSQIISIMKNLIARDSKRRSRFRLFEEKRQSLKSVIYDRDSQSAENRWEASIKLDSLSRDSSSTRLRNRCVKTGRARGNFKKFRLSRLFVRDLGKQGYLPGFKKASW